MLICVSVLLACSLVSKYASSIANLAAVVSFSSWSYTQHLLHSTSGFFNNENMLFDVDPDSFQCLHLITKQKFSTKDLRLSLDLNPRDSRLDSCSNEATSEHLWYCNHDYIWMYFSVSYYCHLSRCVNEWYFAVSHFLSQSFLFSFQ